MDKEAFADAAHQALDELSMMLMQLDNWDKRSAQMLFDKCWNRFTGTFQAMQSALEGEG